MLTIFEKIILGHLVGDYLLQSKKMAVHKSQPGFNGLLWCLAHCILYTLTISIFTTTTDPLKITLIFLSHFRLIAGHWLSIG
jgi:hypothetical protein